MPRDKQKRIAASNRTSADVTPGGALVPQWRSYAGIFVIIGLTCLSYWPSLQGGFLLDDDLLLTQSPLIQASDGLSRIWLTTEPTDYWPITNSSLWFEWRLWGPNPYGYRAVNLILHIASVLLLWSVLERLSIRGAFLAALIFAVHPVNVESVAWIAQRKNLLAIVFFVLSIGCYLEADDRLSDCRSWRRHFPWIGRHGWYCLSVVCFALAMLSKGSVAVLPLLLLLLAWWQRGSIGRSDLLRAAPFFVVALVLTGVNIWFQSHDIEQAVRTASPIERLLGAGAVIWFYLWKALLPVKLAFIYPQWSIEAADWRWWLPLAAAVATTGVLWSQRRTTVGRAILFAWAFFCIALFPVMGFTDVGFMAWSLVADHYQHLALIAVAALIGAGLATWIEQWNKLPQRIAPIGATVAVVGTLAALTYGQAELYGDATQLYRVALEQNPICTQLYNNLGNIYRNSGQVADAINCYEHVLAIAPKNLEGIDNLGVALSDAGRYDEAMARFQEALQIKSNDIAANNGMALALVKTGKPQESIEHFELALTVKPNSAELYFNLADAYLHLGKMQEAINALERSVELNPNRAEVHLLLSAVYAQMGQADRSRRAYERAVKLNPDFAEKFPLGPPPRPPESK